MSVIGLILLILGLVALVVGIILLIINRNKKTVQATVSNPACSAINVNQTILYDCHLPVSFTIGGQNYQQTIVVQKSSIPFSNGQIVTIEYDPTNPSAASIVQGKINFYKNRVWQIVLIVGGILLALFGALIIGLSREPKYTIPRSADLNEVAL